MAHEDKSLTLLGSAEFHSFWILLAIALVVGPLLRALLLERVKASRIKDSKIESI